ncbi:MAG: DUF4270 family protein [Chitinophagaceae bacterium]
MRNIPGVLKTAPFIVFSVTLLLALGCQKTAIQYGEQYVDNGVTNIILVDSISPVVSTIYKDSVITSQSNNLLVGSYADTYFGKTSAHSYVQLAPPQLTDLLNNAQYDSVALLMKCNGLYYGDTSQPVSIAVNQLATEIKLAEGQSYFYNTTVFPVNSNPLGTRTMLLRPLTGDSANIRLDDAKGLELYNMIKTKSAILKDNVQFTDYLKGLQVSANTSNNIFGFKDSVVMRLYYHETDITRNNKYFDFTFYNQPLQFNHITADRSGTPLAGLNSQDNELVSAASGNVGYLQSATGIYLKIGFPGIRKILERSDFIKIIKADLIVKPLLNSYNGFNPLPPVLYAAQTDGANEPGSSIASASSGSAVAETGNLSIDAIYGSGTNYSYDVTSYLQQEITIAAINKNGLLLLPGTDTRFSALNRLVIGDGQNAKNKIQLNVYYISVNK